MSGPGITLLVAWVTSTATLALTILDLKPILAQPPWTGTFPAQGGLGGVLALLLQLVMEWGGGVPFLRATRTSANVRVRPEDTQAGYF